MNFCPTCHTSVFQIGNTLIPIHDKEIISKLSHENEFLRAEIAALERKLKGAMRVVKTLSLAEKIANIDMQKLKEGLRQ